MQLRSHLVLPTALVAAPVVPADAQRAPTSAAVVTIDLVKARPGQRERLIRFYQVNWEQRRIEALERGFISGYRLMLSADTGGRWDVMLETEYPDSAAFEARERNFGELIARSPAQPVDGMMRAALGDIVDSGDLVLGTSAPTATVVEARINRYCHPPDNCELRGGLIWDSTNLAPRYPEVMRMVGIQGRVQVRFVVQPDGTVDRESIVIDRATNRAFEQLTREAVGGWRFRVETSDRPVRPIATSIEFLFVLAMGCPVNLTTPLTSLMTMGTTTQMLIMACPDVRSR